MKIKKLILENIRNQAKTQLELDKVNFFLGPNNAGKSTLLGGIEWGLTGKCFWTDRAGRKAAELIRKGQQRAAVFLEVDGVGGILRSMPPHSLRVGKQTGQEAQAAILHTLQTDEERLQMALNSSSFLTLSASEQRAFLFRVFGLSCTVQSITEKLADWLKTAGHSEEKAKALAEQIQGCFPADFSGGPEILEDMEKWAREERKALKRDKQRAESALAEISEADLSESSALEQVDQLKKKLAELWQRREERLRNQQDPGLPARRQNLQAKIGQQEKRLGAIGAQIASLQERLQQLPVQEFWEDDRGQREQELQAVIDDLNSGLAALKGETQQQNNHLAAVAAAAQALANENRRCPLAPEMIQCGMSPQQVEALLRQMQEEYHATQITLHAKQEEQVKLTQQLQRASEELTLLKQRQAALRENSKQRLLLQGELNTQRVLYKQALEEKETLAVELASLPDSDPELGNSAQELERLSEQMKAIERQLVSAREKVSMARWQEDLRGDALKLTAKLADLEVLVQALGPDGLRRDLLAGILEKFQSRVNHRLGLLTEGTYELKIDTTLSLLCRIHGGTELPLRLLSKSEQLRVGIAIQEALSHAAGLSFLAIDEADMLDQNNRDLLTGMLLNIAEEYDQVLVFTTVGDVKPQNPGIEGVKVFWVEEGKVSVVS